MKIGRSWGFIIFINALAALYVITYDPDEPQKKQCKQATPTFCALLPQAGFSVGAQHAEPFQKRLECWCPDMYAPSKPVKPLEKLQWLPEPDGVISYNAKPLTVTAARGRALRREEQDK
jgi:hypothetical protein